VALFNVIDIDEAERLVDTADPIHGWSRVSMIVSERGDAETGFQ
jgi:hypothetical protein